MALVSKIELEQTLEPMRRSIEDHQVIDCNSYPW